MNPDKPCIIVSITDKNASYNAFSDHENIKGILEVKFDDVDFKEKNCITPEDGRKIVDFVQTHLSEVDEIIVHCEAGISRSAGVCAALMKIVNGDDFEIFDDPRYCPNMACYRTVMEAHYNDYDLDDANRKIDHNTAKWREANKDEYDFNEEI